MAPSSNSRAHEDGLSGSVWATLDSVPWTGLRQAHGTAELVPEALRALALAPAQEVENCYWRLDNVVVLQGSVYESAFYVIPYVRAIVDSGLPSLNRAAAYDLLVEIARGSSAEPDATVIDDHGQVRPLLDASLDRIEQGRSRYEADLQDSDQLVRLKALDLLTSVRLIEDSARLESLLLGLDLDGDDEFAARVREEIADL